MPRKISGVRGQSPRRFPAMLKDVPDFGPEETAPRPQPSKIQKPFLSLLNLLLDDLNLADRIPSVVGVPLIPSRTAGATTSLSVNVTERVYVPADNLAEIGIESVTALISPRGRSLGIP